MKFGIFQKLTMVVGSELEPVIAVRDNHEGMSVFGNLSFCHTVTVTQALPQSFRLC
jgi:hypothetical protein